MNPIEPPDPSSDDCWTDILIDNLRFLYPLFSRSLPSLFAWVRSRFQQSEPTAIRLESTRDGVIGGTVAFHSEGHEIPLIPLWVEGTLIGPPAKFR